MTTNEGIQISGGSFQANSVAVGRNAHAINNLLESGSPGTVSELAAQVGALVEELRKHKDELSDIEVISYAEAAEEELKKPNPDKDSVKNCLRRVVTGITSATSLVNAVNGLIAAAATLL